MNERDTKAGLTAGEEPENDTNVKEFILENSKINAVSSANLIKRISSDENDVLSLDAPPPKIQSEPDLTGRLVDAEEIEDPIFKELSAPKLPELARENRARLQMQSPTRLNFYWSVKTNPFKTLNRAFGGKTGSYTLVIKLLNQTNNREEIFPVEAAGSWWFNVDADALYRAEIGFYAPNRPFIRIMFSNVVETPRLSPSPRRDFSADFTISADQFARVLDVSGFSQDAFEVALAGDDVAHSEKATDKAFSQFVGRKSEDFASREIRLALLALASGHPLESLREQISASLFTFLRENAEKLSAETALASLQENFDIFSDEIEEKFPSPMVFGASLINFPRTLTRRKFLPKFAPVSSLRSP